MRKGARDVEAVQATRSTLVAKLREASELIAEIKASIERGGEPRGRTDA